MDDAEAFELIDAHLDRQPLTDEQSDALTAWLKGDTRRADEAYFRIFLHSYLRLRLQAGILPTSSELTVFKDRSLTVSDADLVDDLIFAPQPLQLQRLPHARSIRGPLWIVCGLLIGIACLAAWVNAVGLLASPAHELYAYEGFEYPATPWPQTAPDQEMRWPVSGGLQGLQGGFGWSEPWQETNSKVAVIVDYSMNDLHFEPKDMRKFGPLGYTDSHGNVLSSAGNQLRTATSPRSISTRRFAVQAFPKSMKDELGLGRDGAVLWFSFLAQSSQSTADRNRYSYLVIGSKSQAGLRVGKLGAAPSGNWTAVGLLTGAEVNLRTSTVPSGEMVFLVTRIIFRPGPEDAAVWINPNLDTEPLLTTAAMRLPVPDFRFGELAVHANHSTDFDEIRFGGTFQAVAPIAR